MKSPLPILLSFTVLCTSLNAVEYGFISNADASPNPNYLVLEKGDIVEVFANTHSSSTIYIFSSMVDINDLTSTAWGDSSQFKLAEWNLYGYEEKTFVDPIVIAVKNTSAILSYKLTRASEEVLTSNTVTLPAVNGLNWAVTLEQSTDLANWTAVAPGTVTGTDSLQFYRVRVTSNASSGE